jgi:CHAD domain-containing protein
MDPASPPTRTPRALIAPASPLDKAARFALAIGVAAMKQHETAAIAGEIEPLHQMRVSARRLRATVQLFAGVIHGSRVNIYQRDLPWLGRAAGAVRECDVIEALIRDCGKHLDPTLATALTPLTAVIAASRDAEHARFVEDLRSPRYERMCTRLADPLLRRALPATDAGCNAPAMLAPLARSVRKAGKRIVRDAPPELFHRLRVRIKRLRYALEMLVEMGGKRSRKAVMRLERMQELLGLHQDAVSTAAWLRAYATGADGVAPETLMAVGATLQTLVERRQQLATRAYRRWRKIVRSGVIDEALKEISAAADQRLGSIRAARAEAEREAHAALTSSVQPSLDDAAPAIPDPADQFAADAIVASPLTPVAAVPSTSASVDNVEPEPDPELQATPRHSES